YSSYTSLKLHIFWLDSELAMETNSIHPLLINCLLVFTFCSIVLLIGGPKCMVSSLEIIFTDPENDLTENVYNRFSENNMRIERSSHKENNESDNVLDYPAGCPDNWSPCNCEKPSLWLSNLEVDCREVSGEDELSDVFRNAIYHDTHLHKFSLKGNPNIKVLHPGVFQHIVFDEIHIGYNNFERVELGALDLMKSELNFIDFFRSNFHNLDDFPFNEIVTFDKLKKIDFGMNRFPAFPEIASESLTWINFGLNPINSIEQDVFRGLPRLKYINLAGTNLAQIYPGTFKGLPYLQEIDLTGNFFLELVAGSIITDSLKLSHLGLESNLISNVEQHSITFNPNMIVDLDSNPISILHENVWRPLFEEGGTIWGNQLYLKCDCDLAWIVLNPMWLSNVTSARCTDGSSIANLDPSPFEDC
ncbi:unnamed protein product, partial [Meganyctiphanes norvegica]